MTTASLYKKTQNDTDSPNKLSVRLVRSILLYCQDWDDKRLPKHQRLQSVDAGIVLCDIAVSYMNDALPDGYQEPLMRIFTKTSYDLVQCYQNEFKSLIENERALIKILEILEK